MKFTKIQPYGPDAYTYWISGIYKIVSYRRGEYLAYYIPDRYKNWGDYVSKPPHCGMYGDCWPSLKSAKGACEIHAASHTPAEKTITRAAEIQAAWIAKAA